MQENMSSFEGAAYGRRMGTWGMSSSGPNASLFDSLAALRARSHQLVRNYSLASGAIGSFVSDMIGTGITPRWQLDDAALKQQIQELWADSVDELDADGVCDIYGQQSVLAHTLIEGGECFGRFRYRRPDDGLIVPLQIQLFEGDHLDESYSTIAENGNNIRMGIEFNKINRRTAYWLYRDHPGENFLHADTTTKYRIPAAEIMHVFRPLRAGQIRGRPWLAPVIVAMHDIDQCSDAELVRRKTTAMFGGFITQNNMSDPTSAVFPSPIGRAVSDDLQGNEVIALEPGTFPKLPAGMSVEFAEPKDVSGSYIDWMKQGLRNVARGIGITYEQLTGDLEGVNYSSIRAGLLQFRRLCKMIVAMTIIHQFCKPLARKWMDMAVLSGALELPDYFKNPRKYQRVQWRLDGWEWVDPLKDQKADQISVRNGFKSRAKVVAELGEDVENVDNEIAQDNQRADGLGLVLDSDPRKTNVSGIYQETKEDE